MKWVNKKRKFVFPDGSVSWFVNDPKKNPRVFCNKKVKEESFDIMKD